MNSQQVHRLLQKNRYLLKTELTLHLLTVNLKPLKDLHFAGTEENANIVQQQLHGAQLMNEPKVSDT